MSDDEQVYYDSDDACDFSNFNDDDEYTELETSDEKEKSVDLSVSYKSFSADTLRTEIDREIEAVVSILGVDRNLALIFLLYHRWDRDKLVEHYSDSPSQALSSIGEPEDSKDESDAKRLSSKPPRKRLRLCAVTSPSRDKVCGVCLDEVSDVSQFPWMKCKHGFCRDCWNIYLTGKIKSEGQCYVRCMADKCKATLSADFIKETTDDEVHERWQVLVVQSYVSANLSLRFCPAPSCSETVQCSMSSSVLLSTVPTVACSLGHSFCFGCGLEDGHAPVVCKIADKWLSSKDFGTEEWIKANTRKCPKCSENIEKAGGCNRMMCRHCRFQFCWMCLRDWNVHGYNNSVCNSYVEPPPTSDMDEAKVNLERWTFYYDRFNNHEVSAKLEHELIESTEEKMNEIQCKSNLSWIETHFMQHALDELTKCRRTLKWTYAMAHYLASGNKKQMFEDIQADLEKAVEQLSQLIDEPIEDACVSGESSAATIKSLRQKVMDKTAYVRKRHEVVLADVAKGLEDGKWDWTIDLY